MQRLLVVHSSHPVDPAAPPPTQPFPTLSAILCIGSSDDIVRCTAEDIHLKKEASTELDGSHVCEFEVAVSRVNVVNMEAVPSSAIDGRGELSMCCSSNGQVLYTSLFKLADSQPTAHDDVRIVERSVVRVMDDTFAVCFTCMSVSNSAVGYEAALISEHLRTYRDNLTTPKIRELTKLKDGILDELLSSEKRFGDELARLKRAGSAATSRGMTPRSSAARPVLRPPPPPPADGEEEMSEGDKLRRRIKELEGLREVDLAQHRAFVAEKRAEREKLIAARVKRPAGSASRPVGRSTTPARSASGARSGLTSSAVDRHTPSRRISTTSQQSTPQGRALTPTRGPVRPLELRSPASARNPSPTARNPSPTTRNLSPSVRPSPITGDKVKRMEDNYLKLKLKTDTQNGTPKAANGTSRVSVQPRFPPPASRLESPNKLMRSGSVTSQGGKPSAASPSPGVSRRTTSPLATQRSMESSTTQPRATSTSRKLLAMSPNTVYRSTSAAPKTRLASK